MKTLITALLTSALLGMSASAWADDGGSSDDLDKSAIISKDYQLGVPSKVLAQAGKVPAGIKPVVPTKPKPVPSRPTPAIPGLPKPITIPKPVIPVTK